MTTSITRVPQRVPQTRLPVMRILLHFFVVITAFILKNENSFASSLELLEEKKNIDNRDNKTTFNDSLSYRASSLNLSLGRNLWWISDKRKKDFQLLGLMEPDADDNNSSVSRAKRKLKPNIITRKKEMLFYDKDLGLNESYADIEKYSFPPKLTTTDFIIRMQEKYEHSVCRDYLNSVPNFEDRYFLYNDDLLNFENDDDPHLKGMDLTDEERKEAREEKREELNSTRPFRYRLYGEECDVEAEWTFWRDMFIVSENDTEAVSKKNSLSQQGDKNPPPPPPSNSTTNNTTTSNTTAPTPKPEIRDPFIDPNLDEYDYVQVEMKDMMNKWNLVWELHRTKGVCNQQLLLECRPLKDSSKNGICKCRTNGVGLPTIMLQGPPQVTSFSDGGGKSMNPVVNDVPIPDNVFAFQYYEDAEEAVLSETVRHYGQYTHKLKCVVAASISLGEGDVHIINPCDYFLPMIGLCTAECHINASCKSINKEEQEQMEELSSKNQSGKVDIYRRIIDHKLHDAYFSKCVCTPRHTCQKVTNTTFSHATSVKQYQSVFDILTLYLTAALPIITMFINCYVK